MELRIKVRVATRSDGTPLFRDENDRAWDFTGETDGKDRSRVETKNTVTHTGIIEGILDESCSDSDYVVMSSWTDINRYMEAIKRV